MGNPVLTSSVSFQSPPPPPIPHNGPIPFVAPLREEFGVGFSQGLDLAAHNAAADATREGIAMVAAANAQAPAANAQAPAAAASAAPSRSVAASRVAGGLFGDVAAAPSGPAAPSVSEADDVARDAAGNVIGRRMQAGAAAGSLSTQTAQLREAALARAARAARPAAAPPAAAAAPPAAAAAPPAAAAAPPAAAAAPPGQVVRGSPAVSRSMMRMAWMGDDAEGTSPVDVDAAFPSPRQDPVAISSDSSSPENNGGAFRPTTRRPRPWEAAERDDDELADSSEDEEDGDEDDLLGPALKRAREIIR
jgi:hypothetical protein